MGDYRTRGDEHSQDLSIMMIRFLKVGVKDIRHPATFKITTPVAKQKFARRSRTETIVCHRVPYTKFAIFNRFFFQDTPFCCLMYKFAQQKCENTQVNAKKRPSLTVYTRYLNSDDVKKHVNKTGDKHSHNV